MLILIPWNCILCQADAIISKFRKTENPEKVLNPTILVAADTVCLASFAFSISPPKVIFLSSIWWNETYNMLFLPAILNDNKIVCLLLYCFSCFYALYRSFSVFAFFLSKWFNFLLGYWRIIVMSTSLHNFTVFLFSHDKFFAFIGLCYIVSKHTS